MIRYLSTRLWQSLLTLVLASMVIFIGIRQLPGDPAIAMAGEEASPEQLDAVRAQLGLDQPLPAQYLSFIGRLLQGDFGRSTRTGTPVTSAVDGVRVRQTHHPNNTPTASAATAATAHTARNGDGPDAGAPHHLHAPMLRG